jgi:hypothetical protein
MCQDSCSRWQGGKRKQQDCNEADVEGHKNINSTIAGPAGITDAGTLLDGRTRVSLLVRGFFTLIPSLLMMRLVVMFIEQLAK